jgi:drug/metabolite transporter (DMT)-like permease
MLNLVFAVGCSVAIGMIFKHTGPMEDVDRTALLTINYAAAVGVAVLLIGTGGRSVEGSLGLSPTLLVLGGGVGALLIAGFFLLAYATDVAGMSLAIGVMRVSVVIPFLASWLVWEEVPSVAQGLGMVLAAAAFFLIARKERRAETVPIAAASGDGGGDVQGLLTDVDWHAFGVLALTFCMGGAVDLSMKTFEEGFGTTNSRVLFLLLAFGVAFLIGAIMVGARVARGGDWPGGKTIGWGVLLGIVIYGSLEFILRAIAVLPGPFVFPANNIAIMVLAAVLGVYLWDEHLSWPNRIGLGLAIVALVMLRL